MARKMASLSLTSSAEYFIGDGQAIIDYFYGKTGIDIVLYMIRFFIYMLFCKNVYEAIHFMFYNRPNLFKKLVLQVIDSIFPSPVILNLIHDNILSSCATSRCTCMYLHHLVNDRDEEPIFITLFTVRFLFSYFLFFWILIKTINLWIIQSVSSRNWREKHR